MISFHRRLPSRQAHLSRALTFVNGLLRVSIYIDAKPQKKLRDFSEFSQNLEKILRLTHRVHSMALRGVVGIGWRFSSSRAVKSLASRLPSAEIRQPVAELAPAAPVFQRTTHSQQRFQGL